MVDKWSQDVTEHSDALDLEEGVFTQDDPKAIARSLKRSAEHSKRRKGTPLQSAERLSDATICLGSPLARTPPSRSSASECVVTSCDHFFLAMRASFSAA